MRWPVVLADVSAMASFAKFTMCATMCTTVPNTIDHAVALWNVMFLSKGMNELSGVLRRMEMKLRQTGRRMSATSTCRTRAAVRAIAKFSRQYGLPRTGKPLGVLTESDTESRAGGDRVVLELVVHETKGDDETVEEDEEEEEHAASSLVNHPVVVLLHHRLRDIGRDGPGGGGVGALEALEPAALCLVALEVAGLVGIDNNVRVLLERGDLSV